MSVKQSLEKMTALVDSALHNDLGCDGTSSARGSHCLFACITLCFQEVERAPSIDKRGVGNPSLLIHF